MLLTLLVTPRSLGAAEIPAPRVVLPLGGPTWHPVQLWRQPEGLPQDTIISIRQTSDGYVWIGTKSGLARFDGVRFTTFKDRALSETEVTDTAEAADGSVWVATYGAGVNRLHPNGKVDGYRTSDGLISDFIWSLCVDANANVWAGTDKGLSFIDTKAGRVRSFTQKDGLRASLVNELLCEADGAVWAGTSGGGLHRVRDDRIEPDLREETRADSVTHITRAPDGAMWIGTVEAVERWKDGVQQRFGASDGLPASRGNRVHVSRTGAVWVGTNQGLHSFENGRFVRHEILADLSEKQAIRAVTSDHEGSLWISHAALGLARLRRGYFATYSTRHGLSGGSVRTVAQDVKGDIWVGTSDGLDRIRNGRAQLIVRKDGTPFKPISSIAEDREGRMWVGTPDGVYRFRPREDCASEQCREDIATLDKGPIERMIVRIVYVDRRGDVWVGTDQMGLARYRGDEVTVFTMKDGLPDDGIRGLAEDAEGRLWIGTKERGVAVFEDGKFRTLTEKDGLAGNMVQALYTGADGSIWVATRQGLTRIKNGVYTTYTAALGLHADHVYGLAEDAQGDLWMGCSRGVFRVRKRDLEDFAARKTASISSVAFGPEHGLKSTEAAVGFYPTIMPMRDGRVWFATTDGVSVVAPTDIATNALPPPVRIEEMEIDGTRYDTSHAAPVADAPPGKGNIAFRYTGLSFSEPLKVRFKVRLDPYDADWIDAANLRLKQYTNIPPGRYKFRVMAANSDGVWSQTEAAFDLRLAPHFYQTSWFYGLAVLGVALAAVGADKARTRRMLARERELAVRVEQAVAQIKMLRGLLPICAQCKKIRDDSGYWNLMETYIHEHSAAEFSHSICPDCMVTLYPEYAQQRKTGGG
jgi:ligand-binding sensor domain-containing protein